MLTILVVIAVLMLLGVPPRLASQPGVGLWPERGSGSGRAGPGRPAPFRSTIGMPWAAAGVVNREDRLINGSLREAL